MSRFIPIIFVVVSILIAIILLETTRPIDDETDSSRIAGMVKRIESYKGMVTIFMVDSGVHTFAFRSGNQPIFAKWVRNGDSLYKEPFADSISVYKSNGQKMRWPILR
jgi:hypothetical protein